METLPKKKHVDLTADVQLRFAQYCIGVVRFSDAWISGHHELYVN